MILQIARMCPNENCLLHNCKLHPRDNCQIAHYSLLNCLLPNCRIANCQTALRFYDRPFFTLNGSKVVVSLHLIESNQNFVSVLKKIRQLLHAHRLRWR